MILYNMPISKVTILLTIGNSLPCTIIVALILSSVTYPPLPGNGSAQSHGWKIGLGKRTIIICTLSGRYVGQKSPNEQSQTGIQNV